MARVILGFPAQRRIAAEMAAALGAATSEIAWHRFPDGESLVRIDAPLAGADVAIVASLDRPDAIALPLRFAAATARELGARSVGLVAPYLAYLRQDRRFHAGETLSALHFATFIGESFDWLVTVDAHLHRARSLDQWYTIPATNVLAAPAVAAWLQANVSRPSLIGPDAESAQWVEAIATRVGAPWSVLEKHRLGDAEVELSAPALAGPGGHTPVLIDDIVSTGRTQEVALRHLAGATRVPPVCIATHAVFAGDAYERLQAAGAGRIVTTDTIAHPSNAIGVAGLLVPAASAMFREAADEPGAPDAQAPDWFDAGEPTP